jgi:hypothetical protein
MKQYEDMLDLPRPRIPGHPRMDRKKRAAQFAPFAALNGYEELVEKALRRHEAAVEAQVERIRDPEKP